MRYLNISLVAVVFLFSCLTYLLFITFYDIQSKNLRNTELTQLVEQIIYYDEVLTMSALMRVNSNDLSWEERYYRAADKLDIALLSALNKLPETQKFIHQTSDANQRLISMETEAFSLANKGDSEAGQRLLSSNTYRVDKEIYSKGMLSLRTKIEDACKVLMSDLDFQLKATVFISSLLCAFIIISLVYAFRHLQHSALHDSLTSLPNRMMLSMRLNQQLADTARKTKTLVAFLDLDGFKSVNDTLGHSTGDILLQIVSKRFNSMQFPNYFVARMGGDEFAFVAEVDDKQEAARFADMILNVFDDPIIVDNKKLSVSGSIGMSLYPDDSIDADTLIKNADSAMYYAKDDGKSCYYFYHETKTLANRRRLESNNTLQKAL
jgi:diguanylate cyclase (GGDEF)-like protein